MDLGWQDLIDKMFSCLQQAAQPKPTQQTPHNMHLTQPQLGVYRGGSLPNVNQTIDLQVSFMFHSL